MTSGEKRKKVFQQLNAIPYIYDGIPLVPKDERSINLSYSKCPKCHLEMVEAYISSDMKYWAHLCGREGSLLVCPYCGEIGNFKLMKMN